MNVREAARELGVSRARVYRLIERGRIRIESAAQPRRSGRFAAGGAMVNVEDVEREKARRREEGRDDGP